MCLLGARLFGTCSKAMLRGARSGQCFEVLALRQDFEVLALRQGFEVLARGKALRYLLGAIL